MSRDAETAGPIKRGVYRTKYNGADGRERLVAVDRHGNLVASTTITSEARRQAILRSLRRHLRVVDPVGHEESQEAGERRGELEVLH